MNHQVSSSSSNLPIDQNTGAIRKNRHNRNYQQLNYNWRSNNSDNLDEINFNYSDQRNRTHNSSRDYYYSNKRNNFKNRKEPSFNGGNNRNNRNSYNNNRNQYYGRNDYNSRNGFNKNDKNSRKKHESQNDNLGSILSELSINAPEFQPGKTSHSTLNVNLGENKSPFDNVQKFDENYVEENEAVKFAEENQIELMRQLNRKVHDRSKDNWKAVQKEIDNLTCQRDRLVLQLKHGRLECLVCCENILPHHPIWACQKCYHVLHLKCIKEWATSSRNESENSTWRCPACQNKNDVVPTNYYCFCGKQVDPSFHCTKLAEYPHSCGDICMKISKKNQCVHPCTIRCHPGPCPPCEALVTRKCGCGATECKIACNNDNDIACDNVCDKQLDCETHKCEIKCHQGTCPPCKKVLTFVCFCAKETREINCSSSSKDIELLEIDLVNFTFSCQKVCNKLLKCGNHRCKKLCHQTDCGDCIFLPDVVKTCPCGQTELLQITNKKRETCLDSIPCCEKICNKPLGCGQSHDPHTCQQICHENECSPCEETTLVRCRCGHMDREILCKKLLKSKQLSHNISVLEGGIQVTVIRADDARCEKRCKKMLSCGKHRCNTQCCIDIDHVCLLICNRMLKCGRHHCQQTCHNGRCLPCYQSSFDELFCECGASVMYPPIPCGTRRPRCDQPCSRTHDCDHVVIHHCHSEQFCPPCTVLTQKWCFGKHEMRKTIPCHQKEFSCGVPCGKPLQCGRHKCLKICHKPSCPDDLCVQPCTTIRSTCGHPCSLPCHDGPCSTTSNCKQIVLATCLCGNLKLKRSCFENLREYQRLLKLATKPASDNDETLSSVETFPRNSSSNTVNQYQKLLKTLECNEECKVIERNRKMAIALQLRNPDLSGKLQPRYSDLLKQWAKNDQTFVKMVHDKLTELVKLAKQSKQNSRSYSFEVMKRDKRQFIHEYCEHFGCDSIAYDPEPNRNVVATAYKDKSWLPSYSVLEVIQRESGQRKAPGPILSSSISMKPICNKTTVLSMHKNEFIDYFDDPL